MTTRTVLGVPFVAAVLSALIAVTSGQNGAEPPPIAGAQTFLAANPPLAEFTATEQRYISAVDVIRDRVGRNRSMMHALPSGVFEQLRRSSPDPFVQAPPQGHLLHPASAPGVRNVTKLSVGAEEAN